MAVRGHLGDTHRPPDPGWLPDRARNGARGAACELISSHPATGAGVAFVRIESDPDPVRVRAGWVSDRDIAALAADCYPDTMPLEIEAAA